MRHAVGDTVYVLVTATVFSSKTVHGPLQVGEVRPSGYMIRRMGWQESPYADVVGQGMYYDEDNVLSEAEGQLLMATGGAV